MVQKKSTFHKKHSFDKGAAPLKTKDEAISTKDHVTRVSNRQRASFVRTFAFVILFCLTAAIWFFVGEKVFSLALQNKWIQKSTLENAETAAALIPDTQVVAVIDNEPIYMRDIRAFAETAAPIDAPFAALYPQLLDAVINAKVVLAAAEKANIENREDVVQMMKRVRDQILSQAYVSDKLDDMITPEAVKARYDAELKAFVPEEEIHASHILVASEKEAQDIYRQLTAGADFATLANLKSLDRNSPDGDLGYFSKGMMIPEFADAVFVLKKGQLSKPIQTPFGWHVVLIQDKRMSTAPSYDEIKEQLRQMMLQDALIKLIEEERTKAQVNVLVPKI